MVRGTVVGPGSPRAGAVTSIVIGAAAWIFFHVSETLPIQYCEVAINVPAPSPGPPSSSRRHVRSPGIVRSPDR